MSRETRRSVLQVTLLLLLAALAAGTGWGCRCHHGSTFFPILEEEGLREEVVSAQGGVLDRWHDFSGVDTPLRAKDVAYLGNFLAHHLVVGLLVPTAPGASEPGSLVAGAEHEIFFRYNPGAPEGFVRIPLALSPDDAVRLAALFPPVGDAQWQALRSADDAWLDSFPSGATTFWSPQGWLYYRLDFHGANPCQGCMVGFTLCTDQALPPAQKALVDALLGKEVVSAGGLTCMKPKPTYVVLTDWEGNLEPGMPFLAALGFYGGPLYAVSTDGTVEIPVQLKHTASSPFTRSRGGLHLDHAGGHTHL